MSPEHAKVLIAEDNPIMLKDMEDFLTEAGHDVVAKGTTLAEAKAMLSQIPVLAKQHGEDKIIVVLGGSLGHLRSAHDPRNDSQVLLRLLKDKGLGHIRTVGYSGMSVPETTVDVGKENGPIALSEAVTALP